MAKRNHYEGAPCNSLGCSGGLLRWTIDNRGKRVLTCNKCRK